MSLVPSPLLRRVLLADAVLSAAFGLVMFAGADLFAELFGLPANLVRYSGLILLPFAGWVGWLAQEETVARGAIVAVIGLNLVWAVDGLLLLAFGWLTPNLLGSLFLAVQALMVAGFAVVEAGGLRASEPVLAAEAAVTH
jgi:hypothetical protein